MSPLDLLVFVAFVIGVVALGLWQSGRERTQGTSGASEYFLAGRGLTWWLVGISLIAANISTEQFVGMSGQAADWLGLAIASYEWMAAVTLVVVAFVFLPTFLKAGIYTIPEFLEYRYGFASRLIMAVATLVILVGVPTASVIFSGAKVISVAFQGTTILGLALGDMTVACWIIGLAAALYVFAGGLKACAWADLVQGAALIAGGAIVTWLAFRALGSADPVALAETAAVPGSVSVDQIAAADALERFRLLTTGPVEAGGKLHLVRPASDPAIPWTALIVGLWIPNFFYWGLNQYIMQRTLGSKSLAEGQKGIVFAAALKLVVPFIVVIPGILAFNLFSGDLRSEAQRRNEVTLALFKADAVAVFPFSSDFARVEPALARSMAAHNHRRAGLPETEALANLDADALTAANRHAVETAGAQGRPITSRLLGYDYDAAFPTLLRNLLREGTGLKGFVFAAIFGAVVSSLASMLNAASTIFAMDLWAKARKSAPATELVAVGRVCVLVFVVVACTIAPGLGRPEFGGIFTFIQEFQGFISPGILAVCLFGLLVPRAPRFLGWLGILLNAVFYGVFKQTLDVAFLDRMAICFGLVLVILTLATLLRPLPQPVILPVNTGYDLTPSRSAKRAGVAVCVVTVLFYFLFW
ncbi:MAG: sodium/solute symporter [Opitutaceae bacterium]